MNESSLSVPIVEIAGRKIGVGHPPYLIAEMSGNHKGDLKRALRLVEAAKSSGADAVKLQTYTADTMTIDHDGPGFVKTDGLWAGRTLYDLYSEASTPWEWHADLFALGREIGITVFSSPFDRTAIDLLEDLGAPAYKIASFEAIDLPLVEYAASTGKPIIISTGICSLTEIEEAWQTCRDSGNDQIVLLHCVSNYPAPVDAMNLNTIPFLASEFEAVIGLSDHTLGRHVAAAGIALGASVIEKHFTLKRSDGGTDAAFSLEQQELAQLCEECRETWLAVGRVKYQRENIDATGTGVRRSLYAVADIRAGETLTPDNVRSIRPGFGLKPKHLPEVLGRVAREDIERGTPLDWPLIG